MSQNGKLKEEDRLVVPDVYKQTQTLSESLQKIRVELENYQEIARYILDLEVVKHDLPMKSFEKNGISIECIINALFRKRTN